jgi:Na+-driven multidrug efflux pump
MMFYYQLHKSTIKLHLNNFKPDRNIAREIFAIGASSFARTTTGSFVIMIVNRTLGTYGGDTSIAAFGIIHRIIMFAAMPLISTGQGLQPILGFSYGAKQFLRAIKATKLAIVVTTVSSLVMFLILYFFSSQITSIFTTDTALIADASNAMRIIFLAFWLVGFR